MIIQSLLDSDLYKFTMQYAVTKLYPYEKVRYEFFNRGDALFPEGFAEALRKEIKAMSELRLTKEEKRYMRDTLYFLPSSYLDFLSGYSFDPNEVSVWQDGGELFITIEGFWYKTILWEVPLMAIISELYFRITNPNPAGLSTLLDRNIAKAHDFANAGIRYCEGGTRRRFSADVQEQTVKTLTEHSLKSFFFGTSNPYLAMKYNLKAVGTQAHEWTQFHGAKYGFIMANITAMEDWVNVYQGELGYALTDTYTSDVFFRDFTMKYAKLFDAVRQDSGEPLVFTDKAVAHYKKLRIEPMSKTAVFSDALNFNKARHIHDYCKNQINDSYLIGTWISNDVGADPLNMVIKMTGWRMSNGVWVPTVKLSDDVGKNTGEKEMVSLCKQTLNIEE